MATFASLIHHQGGLHHSASQSRLYPAHDDPSPPHSQAPSTHSLFHTHPYAQAHSPDPDMPSTPLGRSNSSEHTSPPSTREVSFAELPPARRDTLDGTPPYIAHSSLEVSVPPAVFIRGAGGDYEPCLLMGEVVLNLAEATNIREITAHLVGKAKIHYNDVASTSSRSHSDSVVVLEHEWSFLPGDRRHMHTIKAGRHVFPFQMELDGNAPASLRTVGGNASVTYKIRANAIRGAFATNYADVKTFNVVRTFSPEALEYTQTLELENTWPGKVMYSIMIPHRAHAAGTEVPVSVKFTPLAKGVQVKTITTEIKEYTTLNTKSGPISSTRTVTTAKHEFRDGHAVDANTRSLLARTATAPLPLHNPLAPRQSRSTGSLPALAAQAAREREAEAAAAVAAFPVPVPGLSVHAAPETLTLGPPLRTPPNGLALTASPVQENGGEENVDLGAGDGEIDTTFKVQIPAWATPTHSVKPIQVSHKIKWCCMLSNLDGHTSELRCALPIHILSSLCAEEAWNATSNTRNLLFGSDEPEEPVFELPSYPEHVRDRIANAALDTTTVAPISAYTSPEASPRMTPMALPDLGHEMGVRFAEPFTSSSHISTADGEGYFSLGTSFADSELLSSLGSAFGGSSTSSSHQGSHAHTPVDSRNSSRPSSRPSSRHGSRASSPEPHDRAPGPSDSTTTLGSDSTARAGGLFHLPLSIKPLTSFNAKGKAKATTPPEGGMTGPSPTARRRHGGRTSTSRPPSPPHPMHSHDPLSQVPNYDIASRGFLGGGVVPLTAQAGLPSYDEAERLERSRSDTSLVDLARQVEQASLTDRLNAIANGAPGTQRNHHHANTMAGLQMTSSRRS
ncbi:hypothetical protein CALCODRAFT_505847 [Calocera cornea HHB12733]|uniref:Arrestin C-terminal-like domain-containing protein n=1 Tax=Calocera cornea HHB12733 TaxID=1353952 RepID=A0A165JLU3_9BASI|nr:hypothetical protein CALCODRAFT_505847 [Calocera cornea HHB12733]